jgi:hypothetical protein
MLAMLARRHGLSAPAMRAPKNGGIRTTRWKLIIRRR